jgi:hypothetical protein
MSMTASNDTAPGDSGIRWKVPRPALRAPQVAGWLGVSESKAWQLIASGEIDSFKIDGSRRVMPEAVEAFIARQTAAEAEARNGGTAA